MLTRKKPLVDVEDVAVDVAVAVEDVLLPPPLPAQPMIAAAAATDK
jgi:hypothetical protein